MACVPPLHITWPEEWRRKSRPSGLRNLGNTCYLNSVLQCLTYTPPLADFCLRKLHSSQCDITKPLNNSSCPFCLLETRIASLLSAEAAVDTPSKIYRCLQIFAKHFRSGRQEDAHELLRYAIDACNNACVRIHNKILQSKHLCKQSEKCSPKEEPHTVMKEIFGGIVQNQIRCLTCTMESNKQDDIMDLSLDLWHVSSVKEALCKFFQAEFLDGNNKYQCEKCKKLSPARKQMSIFQAPNVLVIQLKRFENFLGGKIDRHIVFEEKIHLSGYMCKASKDLHPDYSLYGIVVHDGGSQYSGHYYAYVKDANGRWYCCNDAHVTAVSAQTVLAENAYILFYVRSNLRPRISAAKIISATSSTPSPPTTPDTDPCLPQPLRCKLSRVEVPANKKPRNVAVVNGPKIHVKFSISKSKVPATTQTDDKLQNTSQNESKQLDDSDLASEPMAGIEQNNNIHSGAQNIDGAETAVQGSCLEKPGHDLPAHCVPSSVEDNPNSIQVTVEDENVPSDIDCSPRLVSSTGESLSEETNNAECRSSILCRTGQIENAELCKHESSHSSAPLGYIEASLPSETHSSTPLEHIEGAVSGTTSQKRKAVQEKVDISELKIMLEKDGREKLIASGWCDVVRESLRKAKRRRASDELSKISREDLILEVKDSLLQQVPASVKGDMIKQLQFFFSQRSMRNADVEAIQQS